VWGVEPVAPKLKRSLGPATRAARAHRQSIADGLITLGVGDIRSRSYAGAARSGAGVAHRGG